MSENKARNGSELKSFSRSQLKAFGLGIETHLVDYDTDDPISLTITATAYEWNVTLDTMVYAGDATLTLNGRFFMTMAACWLGDQDDRNEAPRTKWDGICFSGTPAPATDTVSVNGLTHLGQVTSQFSYAGWEARGAFPEEDMFETTATKMIFRGEFVVSAGSAIQTTSPEGVYFYGPGHRLIWNGVDWVRDDTLEWIMWYFTSLNVVTLDERVGEDQVKMVVRVEVEVDVP